MDLPPGTGDIAISVAQLLPGAELLVVTTPQLAAAEVAERAGAIAMQTHQRIAGVIENMSFLPCPHCGERVEVFGIRRRPGGGRGADPDHRRPGAAARPGPDRPAAARGRRHRSAAGAQRARVSGRASSSARSPRAWYAGAAWPGASSGCHPSEAAWRVLSGGLGVERRARGGVHRMSPSLGRGAVRQPSTPSRSSSRCLRTNVRGLQVGEVEIGELGAEPVLQIGFGLVGQPAQVAQRAAKLPGPSWAAVQARISPARVQRAPAAW